MVDQYRRLRLILQHYPENLKIFISVFIKKDEKLKITLLLADETLNFLLIFEIKFLLAEFNKHTLTASILCIFKIYFNY
jgi:hypothetical protein